jgi:ferrous iron transport protein B
MISQLLHDELKVLLVGQPNVGKSCLLNALVGPVTTISNYPGTTVETTQAEKVIHDVAFSFIDSPGIYTLNDSSEDERATKEALLSSDTDVAVIVLDANSLERGLNFALQILESGTKCVVAINFIEDAQKKGIVVNNKILSRLLGVPVVPFNPFTGRGLDNLVQEIIEVSKTNQDVFDVLYTDYIEDALVTVITKELDTPYPERFVALRILEGDDDFVSIISEDILVEFRSNLEQNHQDLAEDIMQMRWGTASFLATQGTRVTPIDGKNGNVNRSLKIDELLLHRFWGPVLTLVFFAGLFYVLLILGGQVEEFIIVLSEEFIAQIPTDGSFLSQLLIDGLTGVSAGIAIALPYVFLFYIILGFTEDIGLLPRFVVNLQRALRFFKIPERGFICLMLGLGCTVPAASSTRIVNKHEQRVRLIFLFAFVPCSSRIGILFGIVAYYGGGELLRPLFGILGLAMLGMLVAMRSFFHDKLEPILLELPVYRRPMLSNVLHKSWLRMKAFAVVVIPLLIVGGVVYSFFAQIGLASAVIAPFAIITEGLLGLPRETIVPILFGFIQKDLTGAMLISSLGSDITTLMTPLQILTFGLVTTIGIPCIIVLPTMYREIGLKDTLIVFLSMIILSLVISSLAWRVLALFGFG